MAETIYSRAFATPVAGEGEFADLNGVAHRASHSIRWKLKQVFSGSGCLFQAFADHDHDREMPVEPTTIAVIRRPW